jgi:hypothetical protein
MRKHNIWFFSALLFLVACSDNVPDGVIEQDKMANLLVDVHIVDGSLYNINNPVADSLYKYGINKYLKVFKDHKTDSTQFEKSIKYYALHQEKLEEMYAVINEKLKFKLDSINKVDSLNKVPIKKGQKKNALPTK